MGLPSSNGEAGFLPQSSPPCLQGLLPDLTQSSLWDLPSVQPGQPGTGASPAPHPLLLSDPEPRGHLTQGTFFSELPALISGLEGVASLANLMNRK